MRNSCGFFAVAFVSITLLFSTGCFEDPPFTTGVRVKTVERLVGIGNSDVGVAGVSYSADATGQPGGGSTGSITHIDGLTGPGGISDHPNAQTDVVWSAIIIFTRVIPNCGVTGATGYVQSGGGEILGVCFQF